MLFKMIVSFLVSLGFMKESNGQSVALDVFALNKTALKVNHEKVQKKDPALMPAYNQLLKEADDMLKSGRIYTVMEKKQLPPSGDKHDYMSIAIYYWPDPSKPNGLPYIRKDGQINPEVDDYKDKSNINNMIKTVHTLSLAYYFSGDDRYATMAINQIRAWFLDNATRMNPNLNFAQAIKGVNDGRGIGIIECREFMKVIDGVGLIKSNTLWTKKDQDGIENWFSDFLKWFVTSKNGIEEMNTKNNHGVWYDAQKLAYALFTHHEEVAKSTIAQAQVRLNEQMDTAGYFPAELERTISLHYSAFIVEPFFLIAQMSDKVGVDMWHHVTSNGCSVEKGFKVLSPYLAKQKDWFGQQIKPYEYLAYSMPLLAQGYQIYQCPDCMQGMKEIAGDAFDKSIQHLLCVIDK